MAIPRVSGAQRRALVATRHRLVPGTTTDDVGRLADDVVALHSSDPATVFLSAAVRMTTPSIDAVERALYEDRTLVRHHAMRRTMWVMTPDTCRRAHAAATAKIAAAERTRTVAAIRGTTDIEDPDAWFDDASDEITALLTSRGPMGTRAVGQALSHLVRPIVFGARTKNPAALNAHTKVLQGAGFDGTLVRVRPAGGWTSSEYEWTAAESWLGRPIPGLDPREAAGELLGHWLERFGPATLTDIRWWFGWTATIARTALADAGAVEVRLDDDVIAWLTPDVLERALSLDEIEPWVRLLPGLDVTTMGWKERDWYLDPTMVPRLFDRFGNAGPTVWADGKVVGGWIQRDDGEIAIDVLTDLDSERRRLLDAAVGQLQEIVGGTIVRPRFPAPNQKELLS